MPPIKIMLVMPSVFHKSATASRNLSANDQWWSFHTTKAKSLWFSNATGGLIGRIHGLLLLLLDTSGRNQEIQEGDDGQHFWPKTWWKNIKQSMDSHSQGEKNPSEIQMMWMMLFSDVFQSVFHWSNLASSNLVDVQHMCYVKTYLHLYILQFTLCLYVCLYQMCMFYYSVVLFFVFMSTYLCICACEVVFTYENYWKLIETRINEYAAGSYLFGIRTFLGLHTYTYTFNINTHMFIYVYIC